MYVHGSAANGYVCVCMWACVCMWVLPMGMYVCACECVCMLEYKCVCMCECVCASKGGLFEGGIYFLRKDVMKINFWINWNIFILFSFTTMAFSFLQFTQDHNYDFQRFVFPLPLIPAEKSDLAGSCFFLCDLLSSRGLSSHLLSALIWSLWYLSVRSSAEIIFMSCSLGPFHPETYFLLFWETDFFFSSSFLKILFLFTYMFGNASQWKLNFYNFLSNFSPSIFYFSYSLDI